VINTPGNTKNTSAKPKRANGRGSIYQITKSNGRKVWKAAIKDINGKLRTKNFNRQSEAEDWVVEQRRARELGDNTYATNPKMTVGQYMLGWVESHKAHVKANTYHGYVKVIKNQIIPNIGKLNASALSVKAVESFLTELAARGAGAGTINLTHRTLSVAYNNAVRLRDMPKNPVILARKPRVKSIPTKPIPQQDWQKIYQSAKDPQTHARLEIALMIGLRPGEALGLKWIDIDWDLATITVERQVQRVPKQGMGFQSVKQGGSRKIKISNETLKILQVHKRYQSLQKASWINDQGLIFTNTKGGIQDDRADRLMFKKLCRAAGVPDYQLYQCRKTAFTNMAAHTDMRTVMEFSGHTNVSTVVNSYVFPTTESMTKAIGEMDKLRPKTSVN
jgi:integrase